MEFTLNNTKWKIIKTPKQWLIDKYNSEHDEKCYYVFGLCEYSTHIIHLNEELNKSQMLMTLRHELAHCWLWTYGACYESYSEEDVCNKVSAMCEFIYEISNKYMRNEEV